ncbi:hypothetical protein JTB14_009878 [Gonioctena quinquepunctata]|nr:hypothetical protein JTB14_009878 [Gonioctena quinquepunctata]
MGLAILSALFLLSPAIDAYVFPDDFQLCNSTADNLNDCLLSALQDALPKLADPGITSPITLKTEPPSYSYIEFHLDNPYLAYDEYFHNVTHPGFINSTVSDVIFNTTSNTLNFTTFTPYFVQYSNYKANGTIRYNGTRDPDPVWGFGPCVKKVWNCTMVHQLVLKEVTRDEEEYLEVASYNVTMDLDLITLDYQNIFNGTNPELALRTGGYMNETAMNFLPYINSDIQNFFAVMFQSYADSILGSVPLSELVK